MTLTLAERARRACDAIVGEVEVEGGTYEDDIHVPDCECCAAIERELEEVVREAARVVDWHPTMPTSILAHFNLTPREDS